MFCERTSVGLDVHARSVVAAAIDGQTGEVFKARLTPVYAEVLEWVGRLPGPCAVAYESGPTGFGLARALTGAGVRCEVAASSKLHRPAGDRVKTDARDALHLARLLRLDEVTSVRVPTGSEEAARDLVRAREASRQDLMRARHRLSKLLLRHGIVYSDGKAWTALHDRWLHQQRFWAASTANADPPRRATPNEPKPIRAATRRCQQHAHRSPAEAHPQTGGTGCPIGNPGSTPGEPSRAAVAGHDQSRPVFPP